MADLKLTIDVEKAKADLSEALKAMRNMAKPDIHVNIDVKTKSIATAQKKLDNLYRTAKKINDLGVDIKGGSGSSGSKKTKTATDSIAESVQNAEKQIKVDTNKIKGHLNSISKTYSKVGKQIVKLEKDRGKNYANDANIVSSKKDLEKVLVEAEQIYQKAVKGTATAADMSRFDEIKVAAKNMSGDVSRSIDDINAKFAKLDLDRANTQNFDKLGNRLTGYFEQHRSAIEKDQVLFDKYNTLMHKLQTGTFATTKDANAAFAEFRMQCRKAGVEVQNFGGLLKNTFGSRVRSALAGQGVYMIQTALREIAQSSLEVDTAMTELKKVTDLTATGYNQFLEGAQERASRLGATLTEVINATADYSRLGYDIADATTLADSALIYSNVGDDVENIDDATSALISTMQGFNIAASDSMSIVDKFNNVSNNYASSAGDIGEIVKRSAASMSAAGNSLEQTNNCLGVWKHAS